MNIKSIWRESVEKAVADSALDQFEQNTMSADQRGKSAAFHLAVCLGKCRLFNIDLGDSDGIMPVNMAFAAAQQWKTYLQEMPDHVTRTLRSEEHQEMASDLIITRLDFWAVFLIIDEAYQEAIETKIPAQELKNMIRECLDLLDEFDCLLEKNSRIFSVAAQTNLFDNCRTLMSPEYKQHLPWWFFQKKRKFDITYHARERWVGRIISPSLFPHYNNCKKKLHVLSP